MIISDVMKNGRKLSERASTPLDELKGKLKEGEALVFIYRGRPLKEMPLALGVSKGVSLRGVFINSRREWRRCLQHVGSSENVLIGYYAVLGKKSNITRQ